MIFFAVVCLHVVQIQMHSQIDSQSSWVKCKDKRGNHNKDNGIDDKTIHPQR